VDRFLVTGGAGFIGSAWVRQALADPSVRRLVVLDKLTYAGNLANLEPVAHDPRFRFVRGDIADEATVAALFQEEQFDAVLNFAAESHVDRSLFDPAAFLRTNVEGVRVLLEASRAHGVKRFLQVSTDEVYGAVLSGQSRESDPLRPSSPYSAAKAGGDLLALAYHTTYGLDVVVTRGANTIGPYQFPEKATPLFITNALDNQPLPVYGDGRAVRDYLYVEDHCRALTVALRRGRAGEVYNIGNNLEIDTLTLARAILDLLDRPHSLIRLVSDRPGHDRRYSVESSKLRALGWQPQYGFAEMLALTVAWYRDHEAWWRPLRAGEFRAFYQALYGSRLGLGS
jgi:dTDP-glucose 4,6-dehydratase